LVVEGGNADQLVVGGAGVVAGPLAQPHDGVAVDADEPLGLADAAAVAEVLKHGQRLVLRQAAGEQRRAVALGEASLARLAVEQAALLRAVAGADGDVAPAALAVAVTIGVEAAEPREVVHGVARREVVDSFRQRR
jgi:hypothetical protein